MTLRERGQARWRNWVARRIPPAAQVQLNQRRIFIMPCSIELWWISTRSAAVVRTATLAEPTGLLPWKKWTNRRLLAGSKAISVDLLSSVKRRLRMQITALSLLSKIARCAAARSMNFWSSASLHT